MAARPWGWWTEHKLDILSGYLAGFSNACKRAGTTVYLDLFAGQAENVSRERTQHPIRGSAKRALDTHPPLSVLRFFELPSRANDLEQALKAEYPGRNFDVVPGDCNGEIARILAELSDLKWAPTFAFLDQQSTEVRWPTLEQLARHKRQDKGKVELWLLCASGLLPRGLKIRQELDAGVVERMNAMFDTDVWTQALDATREGILTGRQFCAELTNLMRWRLENVLGYRKTRAFTVTNTNGREIFDMIFATDHDVGDKIMTWVYNRAAGKQPALRLQAQLQRKQSREERKGIFGIFDVSDVASSQRDGGFHVEHEDVPPHPPYQHP